MPFLNPSGHATAADVVAHLEHAIDVCGEDASASAPTGRSPGSTTWTPTGSPWPSTSRSGRRPGVGAAGERADTLPFVLDLSGVDQFHRLITLLEQRGHSWSRIEKVMGRNFIEYAGRVWG